jgi:hypothetical protein
MSDSPRVRGSARFARRLTVIAVAIGSAALALGTNAFASVSNVPLTRVSTDPYTNTTSYHATELEPDNFAWGTTIVAAFQTGRFPTGGSSNTGFATSTDGGATWTHGFMPATTVYADPPGPYARLSDPSVGYDAKHDVWLINSLVVDTKNTDLVNRSTDGGLTWTDPVIISTPTGNADYDKNWVSCDNWSNSPYYGTCYAEVDDANEGDIVLMFTSKDGGQTWKQATVDLSHGLGGQPLSQPNGNVIVPFWSDSNQIQSIVSKDGGKTFHGPYTAATITDHGVPFVRTEPLPSAEIDKKGKVWVVWQDCRFESGCTSNDIVLTTSTDGQTWSKVKRIPIDGVGSGVDHFIPGLGVDRATGGTGTHLALTYYYFPTEPCTIDTCKMYAGYVSSTDGGKTWTSPTQVLGPIKLAWLPSAGGRFVGDYISTSIIGKKAFPVIANAKKDTCTLGQNGSCNEYMVAPSSGLPVAAGTIPMGADRPVAGAHSDHVWSLYRTAQ